MEVQNIPIDQIDSAISNHRLSEDADYIAELAMSIERDGLQQPVRVYRKPGGRFILGFGFNRLAAMKLNNATEVPATVHDYTSDQDILAAQAIENLHRKNLNPLEEARACQALTDQLDGNTVEAAARIGRPHGWLLKRLALIRLAPDVRGALAAGDINLGHADQLARIGDHEKQSMLLRMIRRRGGDDTPGPVYQLRRYVSDELRSLGRVPWDLNVEFGKKPACINCPDNSVNTKGLFDTDEEHSGKMTCLNGSCFAYKQTLAGQAIEDGAKKLLKKKGPNTPKQAEALSLEPYINPAQVARAAKKLADEKAGKTKSTGNRQPPLMAGTSAAHDYWHQELKWRDEQVAKLAEALRTRPAQAIGFALLFSHPVAGSALSLDNPNLMTEDTEQRVREAFELVRQGDLASLCKLAELLFELDNEHFHHGDDSFPFFECMLEDMPDWLIDIITDIAGVTLDPKPQKDADE